MSMPDRKVDKVIEKEQSDNKDQPISCVVCFKHTEIFSIGECDHVVCYECSARLRVLLKQNDCMICRAELSQVCEQYFLQLKNNKLISQCCVVIVCRLFSLRKSNRL